MQQGSARENRIQVCFDNISDYVEVTLVRDMNLLQYIEDV